MPTSLPENTHNAAAERSRRNLWTVIILGIVTAAFYFGFIVMHFHGNG